MAVTTCGHMWSSPLSATDCTSSASGPIWSSMPVAGADPKTDMVVQVMELVMALDEPGK